MKSVGFLEGGKLHKKLEKSCNVAQDTLQINLACSLLAASQNVFFFMEYIFSFENNDMANTIAN